MKKGYLFLLLVCFSLPAICEEPFRVEIEIKNHLFIPSIIRIPSDKKIKLTIHNRDDTAEEFESYPLNREKLVKGGRKAIIWFGPLDEGEYPFFGEFNQETAQGKFIVVPEEMLTIQDNSNEPQNDA